MFDWDRRKLATSVTIDSSVFTVTKIRPSGTVDVTVDNEHVLDGTRKTWLRISDGTLGDLYEIENTITTNEDPAQTFDASFRLLIQ